MMLVLGVYDMSRGNVTGGRAKALFRIPHQESGAALETSFQVPCTTSSFTSDWASL